MIDKTCSGCEYCKYIGIEKTDVYDISLYKCINKDSNRYGMILDEFHTDIDACKEYDEFDF